MIVVSDIQRRLRKIEEDAAERERIHVMIARTLENGSYSWRGNEYSKEELDALVKRLRVHTLIIDDIPRRIEENE